MKSISSDVRERCRRHADEFDIDRSLNVDWRLRLISLLQLNVYIVLGTIVAIRAAKLFPCCRPPSKWAVLL